MTRRWVLAAWPANIDTGAFRFVGTPDEVLDYYQENGDRFPDLRLYELVEIPLRPIRKPGEPLGIRVECPICHLFDYATLDSPRVFRTLSPPHEGRVRLLCPRCRAQFDQSWPL